MFRIPSDLEMTMTFEEATKVFYGRDLLAELKMMDERWEEHCAAQREDMDANPDYEWYYTWQYEINAYNRIVEDMRPLFAAA